MPINGHELAENVETLVHTISINNDGLYKIVYILSISPKAFTVIHLGLLDFMEFETIEALFF